MMAFLVKPVLRLKGEVRLPGDKSIAHRCVILSALTKGQTLIENFPTNKDCLVTTDAFRKLGIKSLLQPARPPQYPKLTVFGRGLYGLNKPHGALFLGDSGTSMRLMLGVLAGCDFPVKLSAGKSLSLRPMLRVTEPLRMMGAEINARRKVQEEKIEEYPPINIWGGNIKSITYRLPVASAQVKSAILLAGLYAEGSTKVIEPLESRDHTERLLKLFHADIQIKGKEIRLKGGKELVSPGRIYIPGDPSSASFFIVGALITPKSKLLLKDVNLNPRRLGLIRVLKRMGAHIQVKSRKPKVKSTEPIGDLLVYASNLKGVSVTKKEIPSLIDELPILMVAASLSQGTTVLNGVEELRVKETDRIRSMSENLTHMGAQIKIMQTGHSEKIVIQGVKKLHGCRVKSFADHRTAMSMIIAGLNAKGDTLIDDILCSYKSFPDFIAILKGVSQ